MTGKNARNKFSRNIRILRKKKWEKNRRKKVRKNVLYSQDIRDQKMGVGGKREIIFPETHE